MIYAASCNVHPIHMLRLPWSWQSTSTSQRSLYSAQEREEKKKTSNRRMQQHDLCPSWIYKYSPLYSNLAWLRKTLLTHTYLSKYVCRGHQMRRVDSCAPAPPPAYTKYVLECQRMWLPALVEYLPALDLAVPTFIKGILNMVKWAKVTCSADWTDMNKIFFFLT